MHRSGTQAARIGTGLGLLVLVGGALAGCGSDSTATSGTPPTASSSASTDGGSGKNSPLVGADSSPPAKPSSIQFSPANVPAPAVYPASEMVIRGNCTIDTDQLSVYCPTRGAAIFPETHTFVLTKQSTAGAPDVAVLTVPAFAIDANSRVSVTGSHALVILSSGDVHVDGEIYLEPAHAGGYLAVDMGGNPAGSGPGGGGGGSLSQAGGGGGHCGHGGKGGFSTASVDNRGVPYGTPQISPLLGGSSGAQGGGGGGGAIQISSGSKINVSLSGLIYAGGGGGTQAGSGAGGGAGGAILLEAPVVRIAGTLVANGGGGSGTDSGADGHAGTTGTIPAPGGKLLKGTPFGAEGGDGAAGTVLDGGNGASYQASMYDWSFGAGGGGAGRIRINTQSGSPGSPDIAGTVSPSVGTACLTTGTYAP